MRKYLIPFLALACIFAYADEGFTRVMVVEEGTYTTCAWCPRGTVAMNNMTDKYPDTFIGIAVHCKKDPMSLDDYENALGFKSFPSCRINRGPISGITDFGWQDAYDEMPKTALGKISVSGEFNADQTQIAVKAEAEFCNGAAAAYNVAIVLLEDDITGYTQSNAYAGGDYGAMGGYEDKPERITDEVFNHVARGIYPAFDGASIAANPKAGEKYNYSVTIDIPVRVQNNSNLYLAALLIDTATGEIVNGGKYYLSGGHQGGSTPGDDDNQGEKDDKEIIVAEQDDFKYIDLGLSVNWAAGNMLGADGEFKEAEINQYGGYIGWADPTGLLTDPIDDYYVTSETPFNISATAYDIARVKWGGDWRLPTHEEIIELVENTSSEAYTLDGVEGLLLTSNVNGNSMFLPLNGTRYDLDLYDSGSLGAIWSANMSEDLTFGLTCHYLDFDAYGAYSSYVESPCVGMAVRPVFTSGGSKINAVSNDSEALWVCTYTIDGRIAEKDAKGILITVTRYKDGHSSATKIVR